MAKKAIVALVVAVLFGVIAGSINFYSNTASQREEASQIAKRAEADLDRVVHAESISSTEVAAIAQRRVADEQALDHIAHERKLAAARAKRFALFAGVAVFALGMIYALLSSKRNATKLPED
jgi:Flp pilus assembly protein TadB